MTSTLDGLLVSEAGRATFQDLGRRGHEGIGLSVNGAADQLAASAANILVGNPRGAVLVETLVLDVAVVASAAMLVAVTGLDVIVEVDGRRAPAWEPLVLGVGQELRVRLPGVGARAYLATWSGFRASRFAGSSSPDSVVGFGRHLAVGDVLEPVRPFPGFVHRTFGLPLFRLAPRPIRALGSVWQIGLLPTEDSGGVEDAQQQLDQEFQVGPLSNHVGLRLLGRPLAVADTAPLISRGIPVGAVEVPPSGEPIVLLRGRFVTAGYPVVGVVTSSSLSVLGQARPGQQLRFVRTDRQDAVAQLRRDEAHLVALEDRVRTAFEAAGLAAALDAMP